MVTDVPLNHLFPYINPDALFSMQWGYKRKGMTEADYDRLLSEKAMPVFEALQRRAPTKSCSSRKSSTGIFRCRRRAMM